MVNATILAFAWMKRDGASEDHLGYRLRLCPSYRTQPCLKGIQTTTTTTKEHLPLKLRVSLLWWKAILKAPRTLRGLYKKLLLKTWNLHSTVLSNNLLTMKELLWTKPKSLSKIQEKKISSMGAMRKMPPRVLCSEIRTWWQQVSEGSCSLVQGTDSENGVLLWFHHREQWVQTWIS